jgi:hypothetical protein
MAPCLAGTFAPSMCIIETRLATLETITDDLHVVRFKTNIKIDPSGIKDILQVADRLASDGKISVMAMIPEDTDFDITIMRSDFGSGDRIKVMAVVCESSLFQCLTELYLKYYPQQFPVKVFGQQEEALIWLEEHPEHRSVA